MDCCRHLSICTAADISAFALLQTSQHLHVMITLGMTCTARTACATISHVARQVHAAAVA